MVELRYARLISERYGVRRSVGQTGLLEASHGRRCVRGVHRSVHVEARRWITAILSPLRPLIRTRVFKNLRRVKMIVPMHDWTQCSRAVERLHLTCLSEQLRGPSSSTGVSPRYHVTCELATCLRMPLRFQSPSANTTQHR